MVDFQKFLTTFSKMFNPVFSNAEEVSKKEEELKYGVGIFLALGQNNQLKEVQNLILSYLTGGNPPVLTQYHYNSSK